MKKYITLLVIFFIISSCSNINSSSISENSNTGNNQSEIIGSLIVSDPTSFLPAEDDAIYLVKITGEDLGNLESVSPENREVIQANVDEISGSFIFQNVNKGEYLMMVRTMGGAFIPARYFTDNFNYAIIQVSEVDKGKTIELPPVIIP
jgi:hypothetical protein